MQLETPDEQLLGCMSDTASRSSNSRHKGVRQTHWGTGQGFVVSFSYLDFGQFCKTLYIRLISIEKLA
jgi:hypothetical protein